jgi:hypothetical protein
MNIILGAFLAALSACGLAASTSVIAQSVSSIEIDATGTCPDDNLGRLPEMTNAQFFIKGLGDTFVLKQDKLWQTSGRASAPVSQDVKLFEKAIIYGVDDRASKLLVGLIRGPDHRICGWADVSTLLFNMEHFKRNGMEKYRNGPPPLMVREGHDGANFPDNELNLKVVLQNLRLRGEEGPPIFARPGASEPLTHLTVFYVFEVFAFEKVRDVRNNNDERYFFLIGRAGDQRELKGWVNEDDVYVWNSRVAVFWNKTGEAKGYYKLPQLKEGRDHMIEEPKPVIEPADRVIGRFPVLEQYPSTNVLAKRPRAQAGDLGQLVEYYRVAMPGAACDRGAAGSAQRCKTAGEHDEARTDLDDRMRKLATVDIVFLIDATESMEPYFPAVREAINQFVREINTDGMSIRVGVAIYGDYEGEVADFHQVQYAILVPMTDPKSQDFRRLDQVPMFRDPHQDIPEGSFAALIRSARVINWNPNAGVRYLVHIGDHGSRQKGKTSGYSTLVERYSETNVAEALKGRDIIYVPVAVQGTYLREHNEAFVAQAREIGRQMPGQAFPVRLTYPPGGYRNERPEDRVSVVHKALAEGVQITRGVLSDIAHKIACAQSADSTQCTEADPTLTTEPSWMGEIRRGLTERHGIPESLIQEIYKKSQTVASYYFKVVTADGRNVFNFWVAMDEVALDRLAFSTGALCENIDRTNGVVYLRVTLSDVFQIGSGDIASVAELFEKRLFIPAYLIHPLLTKPWDKIQDDLRLKTPAEQLAIKKSFCRSSFLISEAKQGKRIGEQDMKWNEQQKRWEDPFRKAVPYKWRYEGSGGVPLYYIPLEFLPS